MGNKTLEVMRPMGARRSFRYAVFDFDGTLSLIREGWQGIMIPYFASELAAAPGAKDESIPHIAWGRYVREGDRITLGLSIEVNHRLLDGLHIGRFAEELTRRIEALPDAPEERIDP